MHNLVSEDYNPVLQNGHFYVHQGEIYCLKVTCEDCEHVQKCMNVDGSVDSLVKTHVRRSIASARAPRTEFIGDTSKVVLKYFQEKTIEQENILYDDMSDKYVCISGTCKGCDHFGNGCNPEVEIKDYEPVIYSMDLKAQEPRCYAMISSEPNWVILFQNDSIRLVPFLYESVSHLFNLILDTETEQIYWEFLDRHFFSDRTDLYALVVALLEGNRENYRIVSEFLLLLFAKDVPEYLKPCESLIKDLDKHFDSFGKVFQDTSVKFPPIGDFHGANAAALFGRDPVENALLNDYITYKDYYRDKAKQCGLALNYGGTTRVIMNAVGCSEPEAEKLFESYFAVLSVFKQYLNKTWKLALKNMYITTMVGRRIYIPELAITDKKYIWKKYSEGKNNVYNYPIQGSGAEMIRIMLTKAYQYFTKFKTTKYDINYLANITTYSNLVSVVITGDNLEEINSFIDSSPTGNCWLIGVDNDGNVLFESDRSIAIKWEDAEKYGMKEAM